MALSEVTGYLAPSLWHRGWVNFVVQSNVLVGNTFMDPKVLCAIRRPHTIKESDFQNISHGDSLTCVLPPNGGGLNPSDSSSRVRTSSNHSFSSNSGTSSTGQPSNTVFIAVGIITALLLLHGSSALSNVILLSYTGSVLDNCTIVVLY